LSKLMEEKLKELNRQLALLKEQGDELNNEARKWAEERNAIHEQIKALRSEAKTLKEKRDTINQQVKELKDLRERAKTERKGRRAEILRAREKLKTLTEKKASRDLASVEKEIENLEWKIQTSSLSVKEEEVLVNRVKILEAQRSVHKQINELKNTLIELQTEEKALGTRAEISHEKLAELAEQSQKFHQQMLELLTKTRNLKTEADEAHRKYLEKRQKAQEMHQKFVELLQQIRSIRQEMERKEKEEQAKRQEQLRQEAEKKALEKMRHGEKLTWEEFKILTEKGETQP